MSTLHPAVAPDPRPPSENSAPGFCHCPSTLAAWPYSAGQVAPQPVSATKKLLDVELLAQGRKVHRRLATLLIRRTSVPPDSVAKELSFGHGHLRHAKREPEQDGLVQKGLEANKVVKEVGVGLRVRRISSAPRDGRSR